LSAAGSTERWVPRTTQPAPTSRRRWTQLENNSGPAISKPGTQCLPESAHGIIATTRAIGPN
jgi:hypothetical protein